ncbi:MAG: radical SAM/SPASM domain-containing protein [Fusicatenibacter sp.]
MDNNTLEKYLIESAIKQNVPISGSLELLPLCNMNCDMCYVRLSRLEMEQQGRLRTPEEWIGIGRQMKKSGVLFLQLTGGEPLLYPGFQEVYLALKQMGMILTLNTNGTLLDEAWADFFAQHKPRRINITLYGASVETYQRLCHYGKGFEQTIRAIKLLKARNVDVKINGSLVKVNQGEIGKLLDIAYELDTPIHIDTYMYPATRERGKIYDLQSRLTPMEAAQARIKIQKYAHTETESRESVKHLLYKADHPTPVTEPISQMKCLAGRSSFAINWQGKMQPCVMLTTPSVSVFDQSFAHAWRMVSDGVKNIRLSPTCAKCSKRDVCQTCAACALYESGSFGGVPEYMCQYTDQTLKYLKEELDHE